MLCSLLPSTENMDHHSTNLFCKIVMLMLLLKPSRQYSDIMYPNIDVTTNVTVHEIFKRLQETKQILNQFIDETDVIPYNKTAQDILNGFAGTVNEYVAQNKNSFHKSGKGGTMGELREKCVQLGGPDAFIRYREAGRRLESCIAAHIDFTNYYQELTNYIKMNSSEIAIKYYCDKVPKLKECISEYIFAREQCFEPQKKLALQRLRITIEEMLNYLCYRGGLRMYLFAMEKGFQCLDSKRYELYQCASEMIKNRFTNPNPTHTMDDLAAIYDDEDECDNIEKLHECLIITVANCSDYIPSEMVESFLLHLEDTSPCWPDTAVPTPPKKTMMTSGSSVWIPASFLLSFCGIVTSLSIVYICFVRKTLKVRLM